MYPSLRKVIKLKEEHNSLQKTINCNVAAVTRMRKEKEEMKNDEQLALSEKEVFTLKARHLVKARRSFIERKNLLELLLPDVEQEKSY